jgi:hypothetical protein
LILEPAPIGGGVRFLISPEPAVTAFVPASDVSGPFTDAELLQAGGLVVREQPQGDLSSQTVVDAVGARAASVRVGLSDGAMVHSDPDPYSGLRTYQLYFADGTRFIDVKGLDPLLVITAARGMYC